MQKAIFGIVGIFVFCSLLSAAETKVNSPDVKSSAVSAIEIYEVQTNEGDKNPYLQVPVTHDLFSFSHTRDLSDLVVLDGRKKILPHRFIVVQPASQVEDEAMAVTELKFIPIMADLSPDELRQVYSQKVKTTVKNKNSTTKVTETKITETKTIETKISQTKNLSSGAPEFYLVDLKSQETDINHLELNWEENSQAQYVEVEIEATQNLEDWVFLGRKMLVQSVRDQAEHTHQFLDNRIAIQLAQNQYDYLRIKVIRGAEFFKLISLKGIDVKKQLLRKEPGMESWVLEGVESNYTKSVATNAAAVTNAANTVVAAWEFTRNETTPVEYFALDIGDQSYADLVSLYSRNNEKQNWSLVYRGPWLHVQVGSDWQTSKPQLLPRNSDTYWRLEMDEQMRSMPLPKMLFSWHPYHLQMIVNNNPPFRLAIDMQAKPKGYTADIFQQLIEKANPVWSQASLNSLNIDPEYTQEAVSSGFNLKDALFWISLCIAVIVLLFFSWKLIQEIKLQPLDNENNRQ